jgi:hypothetical protein
MRDEILFKILKIGSFFNKAIKYPIVKNIFMKFLMHGNNKIEGIPKEPMPLIMVQNSTLHNG